MCRRAGATYNVRSGVRTVRRSSSRLFAITTALALTGAGALAGCGSSTPSGGVTTTGSTMIGPSGGKVTADGVTLTIPAGDLSTSTTIGLGEDAAGPPSSYDG